ncbi:MAG: DUF2110 family protein [Candidatus Lokiarchaeota archaeon]|nr:DUF2110 family protein [Candidatus Lokiarchaeota archaeon]
MLLLTLLDNFYSYSPQKIVDENYLSRALLQLISQKTKEYEVEFEYVGLHQPGNRPMIAMKGKDEKFVKNYLIHEFGTIYEFESLQPGQIVRGRFRDPETVNFGLFIDCGIEKPEKDALYPLFEMRAQLCSNHKVSKRQLVNAYGFFENMPMYFEITHVDRDNSKAECRLAKKSLDMIQMWISDGFEMLFSSGEPRKRIKKAIKFTKHYPDYIIIERMGFLETVVYLKQGTSAPGILADIGPHLKNTQFSMFRPQNIVELYQSKNSKN